MTNSFQSPHTSCSFCSRLRFQISALEEQLDSLSAHNATLLSEGQQLYSAYESKVSVINDLNHKLSSANSENDLLLQELDLCKNECFDLSDQLRYKVVLYDGIIEEYTTTSEMLSNCQIQLESTLMAYEDVRSYYLSLPPSLSSSSLIPVSPLNVCEQIRQLKLKVDSMKSTISLAYEKISNQTKIIAQKDEEIARLSNHVNSQILTQSEVAPEENINHIVEIVLLDCISRVQTSAEQGLERKLDTKSLELVIEKEKRLVAKKCLQNLTEQLSVEQERIKNLTEKIKKLNKIVEYNKDEADVNLQQVIQSFEEQLFALKSENNALFNDNQLYKEVLLTCIDQLNDQQLINKISKLLKK
ncbi:hypothetical protein RCL1_001279 [Eukaryota sp. TZLM3-RCL]